MKKKTLFVSLAFLAISLTSCGGTNFPTIIDNVDIDDGEVQTEYKDYDNGKRVSKITLNETMVNIDITSETKTFQLVPTITPSDAHNKDLTYDSDDTGIATVNEDGLITATGNGSTHVIVRSDNDITESCTVNVYTPVTGISISPHSPDASTTGHVMDIGEQKQFVINYLPTDTNQTGVTWKVYSEDKVTKSPYASISETGLLTVNAPKETKDVVNYVVATSIFDDEIVSEEKITIDDKRTYATGVKLLKVDGQTETDISGTENNPIVLNTSIQLKGEKIPSETTSDKYTFKVKDPSVLSITDAGVVTALKEGSTTVSVEIDDKVAEAGFVVTKIPVTNITLNETSKALKKGETFTLTSTIAPEDASIKVVAYEVTSGSECISVDPLTGVVIAKASGNGVVTCKSTDNNDIKATCSFTVTNAVETIKINNPFLTEDKEIAYGGEELQLTYVTDPIDPDAYEVEWTSDATDLATISSTGLITTNDNKKTGKVTFTVKVVGTDIKDTITLNVVSVFESNKEYLVGNRSFAKDSFNDYQYPSWDNCNYALTLEDANEGKQDIFEQQWVAKNVYLQQWDETKEEAKREEIRVRGYMWHDSCSANPASTNLAKPVDNTFNFKVEETDQYNIYFQKLTALEAGKVGVEYYIYIEKAFSSTSYYVVGNKDYHSGTSQDTGESWHDISKALVMTPNPTPLDPSIPEYQATVTFEAGDIFKIRNNNFFDIAIEEGSISGIHKETTGNMNFVVDTAGTYVLTFKQIVGADKVFIASGEKVPPTGITLNKSEAFTLDNGTSVTLVATIAPADCTYKEVEWTSSDPTVASITKDGVVTALKDTGTTTITANIKDETYSSIKATVDVTVKPFNFVWGVASSTSNWQLDTARTLNQTDNPIGIEHVYAAYKADLTFKENEEWKITSNDGQWINNNVGSATVNKVGYDEDMSTVKNVFTIADNGNIKTLVAGTYEINLIVYDNGFTDQSGKIWLAGMSIFAKESGEHPVTDLEWGIAGTNTSWSMGQKFEEVEVPVLFTADKAYKISSVTFAEDDEWKVKNTHDEWINNAPSSEGYAGVGIDLTLSTEGAFDRTEGDGNILVNTAGTYEILLLEYTSTVAKDGSNYYSGYQIIATKVEEPEPPAETYTVTYYLPAQEDELCASFRSDTIEVAAGTKLSDALTGKAVDFGSFKFKNWSSSKAFEDNCDATSVNSNMTVYARFERSNVLYYYDGTSGHFCATAPSNDVTIDSEYRNYSVGTQLFGKTDFLVNDSSLKTYDIGNNSGVFKFTLNDGNWVCQRKVIINIGSCGEWTSAQAKYSLDCWTSNGSHKTIDLTMNNNQATAYIDVSYVAFKIDRWSPQGEWWNKTVDIKFNEKETGTAVYGKDHLTLYVQNNKTTDNLYHYNWW